jgi:hypothetical protein
VGTSEFKKAYRSKANFISYIWDIPGCVSGHNYIFIQFQSRKATLEFLFHKRPVPALASGYHQAVSKIKGTEKFTTAA